MNEDRIWEMYFSTTFQAATRAACHERIGWFVGNARGRVLDIGCSQGLLPVLLARAGHQVTGVDVEPPSLEFARQRVAEEPAQIAARVELLLSNVYDWDPGVRFDTVCLGEVLEHLPEPARMVAAARRLILEGGRLLVTVPMGWLDHHDHRQEFLPASLVALMEGMFGVEAIDIVDDKIRLLGVAGAESRPEVVAPRRLAEMVAGAFLELQHELADQEAVAREVRHEVRERESVARAELRRTNERRIVKLESRIAELTAKVDRLATEKKKLRDSASYQLGHTLVGAAMNPRAALGVPRRIGELVVRGLRARRNGAAGRGPREPKPPSARDVYSGRFRVVVPGAMPVRDPVEGRVLHLLEYSLPHTQNGYTLRSLQIVQAQKQHGWDPVVVTKPGFPEGVVDGGPEEVAGVPHYRLTGRELGNDRENLPRYIEAFTTEAAPLVDRLRPSIVHAASNFRNAYPALELARNFNLPFVYEVRGLWEETRVANGTLSRADAKYESLVGVEAYCAKNADAVVTLGQGLKQELVQRGVPAEKIFLVPNAVEAPAELPLPRPDLLAALGLSGRFVVSYLGSVTPLESLHILVEAVARLRAVRRDIGALIVGDGAALESLRALAERLGVDDCIRFTGSVPHQTVREYYAVSDAVACTRGHDRVCSVVTPLKPYEAMAYAKPVIVSDIPALREMVTDHVTGRLVRAEDAAALASVIAELADDPQGRRALGERASAWVREHRTWHRVTEGYRPAYDYARLAAASRMTRTYR